jgi:hypothetical protein
MVPIPVFWTEYTATMHGRVLKLVPCENCATEYVYVLEREGSGVGTSVYLLNDEGAQGHAASAAGDTLQSYLENGFDPVPCPACGHYQRYMFPKLLETKSLWGPAIMLVVLLLGCLDAVSALYWSVAYLQHPNDHALGRMVLTWSGCSCALSALACGSARKPASAALTRIWKFSRPASRRAGAGLSLGRSSRRRSRESVDRNT